MSVRNYTYPDTLNVGGTNTVSFTLPFEAIIKPAECFFHVTTVLVGGATIEIREGTTPRATITLPAAAADNSSVKAVATGTFVDFHAAAGTVINVVVTSAATSGAGSVTIAYAPAVQ